MISTKTVLHCCPLFLYYESASSCLEKYAKVFLLRFTQWKPSICDTSLRGFFGFLPTGTTFTVSLGLTTQVPNISMYCIDTLQDKPFPDTYTMQTICRRDDCEDLEQIFELWRASRMKYVSGLHLMRLHSVTN